MFILEQNEKCKFETLLEISDKFSTKLNVLSIWENISQFKAIDFLQKICNHHYFSSFSDLKTWEVSNQVYIHRYRFSNTDLQINLYRRTHKNRQTERQTDWPTNW